MLIKISRDLVENHFLFYQVWFQRDKETKNNNNSSSRAALVTCEKIIRCLFFCLTDWRCTPAPSSEAGWKFKPRKALEKVAYRQTTSFKAKTTIKIKLFHRVIRWIHIFAGLFCEYPWNYLNLDEKVRTHTFTTRLVGSLKYGYLEKVLKRGRVDVVDFSTWI